MKDEGKCKERIAEHLASRLTALRYLYETDTEKVSAEDRHEIGVTFGITDAETMTAENLSEALCEARCNYGLSFDYVAPGTFPGQRKGYFRYQLSWGGPSDEFRFFVNPDLSCYRIEYWFMDWFDGAKRILTGKREMLLLTAYEDFKDMGVCEQELTKAQEA